MKIYILTKNRVDKQITLESIPPEYLDHTYLVCGADEIYEHVKLGRQCIAVPNSVTNYSQKFQWLIDGKASDDRQFIMMDDDLFFNRRHVVKPKLLPVELRDLRRMFGRFKEMNQQYALSGIHPRQMGHDQPLPQVKNTRLLCVHNINLDLFPKKRIKVDYFPILADKILNCELLSQGIPNAAITDFTVDWGSVQAPGGCSDYRTAEMQRQAVQGVADMYAPFAKAVIKKPKAAKWLGEERWDLRVQWKKLYKHGVANNAN